MCLCWFEFGQSGFCLFLKNHSLRPPTGTLNITNPCAWSAAREIIDRFPQNKSLHFSLSLEYPHGLNPHPASQNESPPEFLLWAGCELTALVEENFSLISHAWRWWKENKHGEDEAQEQISNALEEMSGVQSELANGSPPQAAAGDTFILQAEIQSPSGPLGMSMRFSSRENDCKDHDWLESWQMAARALLTPVIKAVRICVVHLQALGAEGARTVGRAIMEHLLALEDVHLAPV